MAAVNMAIAVIQDPAASEALRRAAEAAEAAARAAQQGNG